jgi:hypothetical protein
MSHERPKLSIVSSGNKPASGDGIKSKPIDAHATFLARLPDFEPETLRTIFQKIVEDGPRSLVEPIEVEFASADLHSAHT